MIGLQLSALWLSETQVTGRVVPGPNNTAIAPVRVDAHPIVVTARMIATEHWSDRPLYEGIRGPVPDWEEPEEIWRGPRVKVAAGRAS